MYFLKIPDYFSYDICTSLGFLNQQTEEKLPCHQNSKIYGSHEKQIREAVDLHPNSVCERKPIWAVRVERLDQYIRNNGTETIPMGDWAHFPFQSEERTDKRHSSQQTECKTEKPK